MFFCNFLHDFIPFSTINNFLCLHFIVRFNFCEIHSYHKLESIFVEAGLRVRAIVNNTNLGKWTMSFLHVFSKTNLPFKNRYSSITYIYKDNTLSSSFTSHTYAPKILPYKVINYI